MKQSLKIAIGGVGGRMGRQLIKSTQARGHALTGGTERPDSAHLNIDIGELADLRPMDIFPSVSIHKAVRGAEVWVDFTQPQATLTALQMLNETSIETVIIGTTGFSAEEEAEIEAFSQRYTLIKSGNFSLGIALLARLTELAAKTLDTDWDIEILETHHRHKVDAPSGTALMLGQAAIRGRTPLADLSSTEPYHGVHAARKEGQIGFAVRRSGGIIGEHEISFTDEMEQITLAHKALDRKIFAQGAIKAAEWGHAQPPGLYTLNDVLGLADRASGIV